MKFYPRCGSKNSISYIVEDGKLADEVRKEYLKNQKKINNHKEG